MNINHINAICALADGLPEQHRGYLAALRTACATAERGDHTHETDHHDGVSGNLTDLYERYGIEAPTTPAPAVRTVRSAVYALLDVGHSMIDVDDIMQAPSGFAAIVLADGDTKAPFVEWSDAEWLAFEAEYVS